MGFLRQNKDGTTSMKILVDSDNDLPERVISLGAFTGKLQQGTGQLQVIFNWYVHFNTSLIYLSFVGVPRGSSEHSKNCETN